MHLRTQHTLLLASLIAAAYAAGCGSGDTSGNGGTGGLNSAVTSGGGAPGVTAATAGPGSTSGNPTTGTSAATSGTSTSTHAATTTTTSASTSTHAATTTTTSASTSTHAATTTTAATTSAATTSAASTSSSTSGAPATCSWDSTVHSGTSTEYSFGQGTTKENNYYKTACGFYGTEPTNNGFNSVDMVLNTANTGAAKNSYFVAIPSSANSATWPMNDCGACIEFTGSNGTKVIATVIDECPTSGGQNPPCLENNHLDLSTSLFGATMVQSGKSNTGGDLGGGSWKFIACPVTGDIMIRFNNGYAGQIYIQNMIFPIKSATANGQAMTQSQYGYWSAGSLNSFAGVKISLTDVENHTVTGTVPSADNTTGASLGVQFPSPGTCSL